MKKATLKEIVLKIKVKVIKELNVTIVKPLDILLETVKTKDKKENTEITIKVKLDVTIVRNLVTSQETVKMKDKKDRIILEDSNVMNVVKKDITPEIVIAEIDLIKFYLCKKF